MNMSTPKTPRSHESLMILNFRDGESSITVQCEINELTITEATLIEILSYIIINRKADVKRADIQ
jgi:hypothetical protein